MARHKDGGFLWPVAEFGSLALSAPDASVAELPVSLWSESGKLVSWLEVRQSQPAADTPCRFTVLNRNQNDKILRVRQEIFPNVGVIDLGASRTFSGNPWPHNEPYLYQLARHRTEHVVVVKMPEGDKMAQIFKEIAHRVSTIPSGIRKILEGCHGWVNGQRTQIIDRLSKFLVTELREHAGYNRSGVSLPTKPVNSACLP